MSVQKYPSGKTCPHCVWVADDPRISAENKWGKIKIFHTIPAHTIGDERDTKDPNFLGMTIVDGHGFFRNTLNCVYGVKGQNSEEYHKSSNVGQVLYGATLFIEYLNSEYNIKHTRLLINSNYNREKYGGKEHVHALVTIDDSPEENKKFFDAVEEKLGRPHMNKRILFVESEPYPQDTVYILSGIEAKNLIHHPLISEENIEEIFSKILKFPFDPRTDSYYIFLKYGCNNNRKPRCGKTIGKISTSLSPKQ